MGNANCGIAELLLAFQYQLVLTQTVEIKGPAQITEYSGHLISLKSHRCKEGKSLCATASNCISYCSKRVCGFCECVPSKGCSVIHLKLADKYTPESSCCVLIPSDYRLKIFMLTPWKINTKGRKRTPIFWNTYSRKSNILYLQILHCFLLHFVLHFW